MPPFQFHDSRRTPMENLSLNDGPRGDNPARDLASGQGDTKSFERTRHHNLVETRYTRAAGLVGARGHWALPPQPPDRLAAEGVRGLWLSERTAGRATRFCGTAVLLSRASTIGIQYFTFLYNCCPRYLETRTGSRDMRFQRGNPLRRGVAQPSFDCPESRQVMSMAVIGPHALAGQRRGYRPLHRPRSFIGQQMGRSTRAWRSSKTAPICTARSG